MDNRNTKVMFFKSIIFIICAILCVSVFVSCQDTVGNDGSELPEKSGEAAEETKKTPETLEETVFESKAETEAETPKETVAATFAESEEVTTVETEVQDPITGSSFAEIYEGNEELADYDVHMISVDGIRFRFWEYSMDYSAAIIELNGKNIKDRGRLLLPDGYTDGMIFNAEKDAEGKYAHTYVTAKKNGEMHWFEYIFDLESDSSYPISRTELTKEEGERLTKKKNSFSGKIYHGGDGWCMEETYGDFEIEIPIAFSGYYADTARVVYCDDGAKLENMALRCATGYASAYPLESYELYTESDGFPYETQRFRWCRLDDPNVNEDYYTPLESYNKRDHIYMMKVEENYYVYISIEYYNRYNPPENSGNEVADILRDINVRVNK